MYDNAKNKINLILEKYEQQSRIVEYAESYIKLSTGHIIIGKEKKLLRQRLMYGKHEVWAKNFDDLLAGIITIDQIKHNLAVERGKKCQEIHGEKIKLNLNTGVPWTKGRPGTFTGMSHTEETKATIGEKNSGPNNGMWGKRHSQEVKDNHSNLIKDLILSGKFTPNNNNRNTHWDTTYNGRKYRSSWEALYHYHNPAAQYEDLRISYEWEDSTKVYIVDFIDYQSKLVVEVKPLELCKGGKFIAKWSALQEWAKTNNYTAILVDKEWFKNTTSCPDLTVFNENTARKIGKIYETGKKSRNR
jgi:hypothetical protein